MLEISKRRSLAVFAVMTYATFLTTLNETILNVALTNVMTDFSITFSAVQWTITGYMLMAAVMVPVTGFLYRKIPTKRLFLIALSLLLAGTLVGAFANSFPLLLLGRIVQAAGTGMVIPININVTMAIAPKNKLGTYMGIAGAATTIGPAFGPILAGVLLNSFTWHALFWFYLALAAVCAVITLVVVPKNVATLDCPKIDVLSVTLISVALIGILCGISNVFTNPSGGGISLVAGICAGAFFVKRQMRLDDPFLNVAPFHHKHFVLPLLIIVIALMTVFSMNILLPLFFEGSLQFSPFDAALMLLPATILSCVLTPFMGRAYDRFGIKVVLPVGLGLIAIFAFALAFVAQTGNSTLVVLAYVPVIVGVACAMSPAQSYALSSLPPKMQQDGATIVSTGFQIAGCLGSSLFSGVLSAIEMHEISIGTSAASATAFGFSGACVAAGVIGFIGFIIALCLSGMKKAPVKAAEKEAKTARETLPTNS